MRIRLLQFVALAAALLGAACDRGITIEGSVKSPTGGLAGADVTLSCPPDPPVHITTNELGGLRYHSIPTVSPECHVIVSKPGFRPREIPLAQICTSHFGLSCSGARLEIELAPEE